MAKTVTDSRNVIKRGSRLEQLSSKAHYDSTADAKQASVSELDNMLDSVNAETTPPLRLDASDTPDLTVSIGAATVSNPETGRQKSIPHVGGVIPAFTSGTVVFPASSGGNMVVTPGTNIPLTVASNEYVKVLFALNSVGEITVVQGASDAVEADALVPSAPANTLAIGFVSLFNNAGTIDNIVQSKIFQFGTGSGDGGTGDDYQRNYLINGAMEIAQRGSSFVAAANETFIVDRMIYSKGGAMVHTVSQDSDVPTLAEAGYKFSNSIRLNLTTPDDSIGATDLLAIQQRIEGYNWADIAGKIFTLSFWVKATLAGTYAVAFRNSGSDRSFISEYTIDSSNTWEYKTVTVSPAPEAGTWDYDNGIGLRVLWGLAVGSNFHGSTTDAWIAEGNVFGTSNQVNGAQTGATDFRLAGVQINEGAEALPFRRAGRDFAEELQLCQRYYEKSYDINIVPGTGTAVGRHIVVTGTSNETASSVIFTTVKYKVPKRASATRTIYSTDGTADRVYSLTHTASTVNAATSNYNISGSGEGSFDVFLDSEGTAAGGFMFQWTADAEL